MSDIDRGLDDLAHVIEDRGITSIAIPRLGCDNGGLDWTEIEPLIRKKLNDLPAMVHLFVPEGPLPL
ncbi:hypothetical protein [Candidatus Poriferisocius sp.]|uniref:hypothetical protein n=1 Tax=Candidatus Poriferisocius sp. TaxID=3101276 RepID=UPI003B026C58